jgi:hypothetical protein
MSHGARQYIFLITPFLCAITAAQDPIRVESTQVLVPAVIFDKQLYGQQQKQASHGKQVAVDPGKAFAIPDLEAKDLRLFQDGQEQQIQSLRVEPPHFKIVRDSLGIHPETVGTGGGRWAHPDVPESVRDIWFALPQYVIAYVPPSSPEGSCHTIKVKVTRFNAVVFSRSEYCNTLHAAADPLNGTPLGNRMTQELASTDPGTIPLKLQAVWSYKDADASRVTIDLEFPAGSLRHEFHNGYLYATIGAMGMVYRRDGSLAVRFSDFACCDYGTESKHDEKPKPAGSGNEWLIPTRLETQIALPPGEYTLQVVLSDGAQFGRAQIPLVGEGYDATKLAISDVALSGRVRKNVATTSASPDGSQEGYAPLTSRNIQFTPATDSIFTRDKRLFVYLEVLAPAQNQQPSPAIQVQLRIQDAKTGDTRIVYKPIDVTSYLISGSGIIPIIRGIELTALPDGSYRLEAKATDENGKSTIWRGANFSVQGGPGPIPLGIELPEVSPTDNH